MRTEDSMKIGIVSDIHCDVVAFRRALDEMGPVDMLLGAGDWVLQYRFSNEIYDMIRDYNIIAVRGNHDMAIAGPGGVMLRRSGKIAEEHQIRLDDMPAVVEVHIEGKRLLMMHTSRLDPTGGGRDLGGASLGKVVHHFVENGGSYGRVPYEELGDKALLTDNYVMGINARPTNPGQTILIAQDDGFREANMGDLPEVDADILVVGHTHQPVIDQQGSRLVINPGSLGQPRNPAFPHRRTYAILDTKDWSARIGEFQQQTYDE
jgi:predicted phosphodiesterase